MKPKFKAIGNEAVAYVAYRRVISRGCQCYTMLSGSGGITSAAAQHSQLIFSTRLMLAT